MIGTSSALREYLQADMCSVRREGLRVLYLNALNHLLMDDATMTGTVDAAPFYAREIIGRAIEVGSTSLILVHNHPSGDPQPSRRDVEATRALAGLCSGLGITLLDHLIVGGTAIVSLRAEGHLER